MIVWCAYCQTFQGEKEPFDDYELTHTLCAACDAAGGMMNEAAIRSVRPIAEFYNALRKQAATGAELSTPAILEDAQRLGVSPMDLLWGMVQPALHEMGVRWARSEVTIAIEHRFSMNVERIIDSVAATLPQPAPTAALDFLLVNAADNHHTLGLRMLELLLRRRGSSTYLVVPGLPPSEVIALARSLAPKTVGVSIALAEQAASVRETLHGLSGLPKKPRMIVGGYAVKMGLVADLVASADVAIVPTYEQALRPFGT
jgi:methanogenic corrinoid protein MtbC1